MRWLLFRKAFLTKHFSRLRFGSFLRQWHLGSTVLRLTAPKMRNLPANQDPAPFFLMAHEMREISHVNCGLKTSNQGANPSYRWLANTSEHEGVSPSAPCATFSSNSEDATAFAAAQAKMPALQPPCLLCTLLKERCFLASLCLRQLCQEGTGFGRPATSDFDGQDDQTGPTPRTRQLWIAAFLSSSSSPKNHTVPVGCTVMRGAIAMHRTHQCGVDGQLTTPEQGKPVHNHFQTAAVGGQHRKVHISHQTVRPNTSSCLPANASSSTFESEPPSAQHSRPCACSTVVAKRIDWTATPATKQGRR